VRDVLAHRHGVGKRAGKRAVKAAFIRCTRRVVRTNNGVELHGRRVARHARRGGFIVRSELRISQAKDALQVRNRRAVVAIRVLVVRRRSRSHVKQRVEHRRSLLRGVSVFAVNIASDDAVQRLTFRLVIRVRRGSARRDRLVNFVRVLDDALAVDDAHLLLNIFVNVVELVAILLLLAVAQVLDNLFVRRRDGAAHGAEFRAALVRAPQNG